MKDVIEVMENFLNKAEPRFKDAPFGMTFEKEKSYAIQLFRQNEYLEEVAANNPQSLLSAMSNVSSIGLSLNPAKKQAYLVPRKGQICLDPSYIGLCDLAIQSGRVEFVQAKVVKKNDTYVNKGIDLAPLHEYEAFGDRGDIVGVYCVAKTIEGNYLTTELSREQVDAIRDRSEYYKRKKDGPWVTDYDEMAKKTVIRNAFKTWPKTETMERLEHAVLLSNENEGFEPIINNPQINNPQISDYTPDQKQYFDGLITKSDAIGLFCFMRSVEEGVWISLYNSFEDGSKIKYKQIVNGLTERGESLMADIRVTLQEAAENGDDHGAREILEELSQEAIDYILDNVSMEVSSYLRRLMDEN